MSEAQMTLDLKAGETVERFVGSSGLLCGRRRKPLRTECESEKKLSLVLDWRNISPYIGYRE